MAVNPAEGALPKRRIKYTFYGKMDVSPEIKLLGSDLTSFVLLAKRDSDRQITLLTNIQGEGLKMYLKALAQEVEKQTKPMEKTEIIQLPPGEDGEKMIEAFEKSGIPVTRMDQKETPDVH